MIIVPHIATDPKCESEYPTDPTVGFLLCVGVLVLVVVVFIWTLRNGTDKK